MMTRWQEVLDEVATDKTMLALWSKYAKKNPYAADIELAKCCQIAEKILGAAI